jgi:hypothetical protein
MVTDRFDQFRETFEIIVFFSFVSSLGFCSNLVEYNEIKILINERKTQYYVVRKILF